MKQGDIVLIHFPFTNLTGSKLRPALIVSNASFNCFANIILLAISTKKAKSDYSEEISQSDLETGTLLKTSYVRFSNILSLEKTLVLKKVAELNSKKQKIVKDKLWSFIN